MPTTPAVFAVNWDYRCPFARNAHEHMVTALQGGAEWDVSFVAFSLSQVHVEEGETSVWEDEDKAPHLLAMEAGIVVRDRFFDRFFDAHLALFRARHDEGRDLREEAVVRDVLGAAGVDADAVFAEIADGWPRKTFRAEHERWVDEHKAFGVPTFVAGAEAVFVRLVNRPQGDAQLARQSIDRIVHLLGWPELNEFKHTSIRR